MTLRAVFTFLLTTLLSWGADRHITQIREYTRDGAVLADLSPDGNSLLTRGDRERKIPGCAARCDATVLTVYDTENGRLVRELVVDDSDLRCANFAGEHTVRLLRKMADDRLLLIEWDFVSGATSQIPFLQKSSMQPVCFLDGQHILAYREPRDRVEFAILSPQSARMVPRLESELFDNVCRAWKPGNGLLAQTHEAPESLAWLSAAPSVAPARLRDFHGERIFGYALSPDRNLIAVVTATMSGEQAALSGAAEGPGSPANPAFLHVLDAESGAELSKFPMDVPPKPVPRRMIFFLPASEFLDDYHFPDQFARSVAISPDHKLVAVSYGVHSGDSAIAWFGIYSLDDGHRIATIRGDTIHKGPLWAVLHNREDGYADSAPLSGAMAFSPDSRVFYATSDHLHQWDVSGK